MSSKIRTWMPWAVIIAAVLASVLLVNPAQSSTMKVQITINGQNSTAVLVDSATTRDFVSLLPLTITMTDLFAREKSGDLPRPLAEGGERTRTYQVGEIIYWSPSAHLAVYYHDDRQAIPSPGIIVLGKLDGSVEAFRAPGPVSVTIRAMNDNK